MAEQPLTSVAVNDLALRLESMTDDELFSAMQSLEQVSESSTGTSLEEAMARIALVESVIEDRYPGQLMQPYQTWKAERARS